MLVEVEIQTNIYIQKVHSHFDIWNSGPLQHHA